MQTRTLLFSALLFFGLASVQAQSSLSIQGTLQKSTGVSEEDGLYTLTFRLYTVETGGTPVWTEKQDSVVLLGGVYSVVLGTITPLTPAFDQPYFLGISVGPGAELNPRARLTSAPYALSLLGQSNTFPSSGTVGAGTATPTAGYQLHVKNPDAEANVLIDGSSKSSLVFKKGAKTQDMSYDGSKISVPGTFSVDTLTVGTLQLTKQPTGDSVVANSFTAQTSSGAAGEYTILNHTTLNAFKNGKPSTLYLNHRPGAQINAGAYDDGSRIRKVSMAGGLVTMSNFQDDFYVMRVLQQTGTNWSAAFEGPILVRSTEIFSDKRIKKDINYLNGAAALNTLMKLQVADYRLIEEGVGAKVHKGFIAQEVEAVLPDVVSTMPNVIPDINAFAQHLSLTGDQLSIVLDTKHGLQVGDRVSLGADKNSKELFTVCKTETAQSFSVSNWESALPEKLLVYGREVKDFKVVNYQEISNLNVSATQELARRVAELEAENAALRSHNEGLQKQNDGLRSDVNALGIHNEGLQKQNDGLRSDVNDLGSRLSKLENLLISNKGQR
jgi:hypothetical protein